MGLNSGFKGLSEIRCSNSDFSESSRPLGCDSVVGRLVPDKRKKTYGIWATLWCTIHYGYRYFQSHTTHSLRSVYCLATYFEFTFTQHIYIYNVFLKYIRKERKLNTYNALIKSSLLYGSETWRLTENNKRRVEATEMDALRRSSRISRKERIRNVTIRQQIGLEETIVKEIEQNQLTWYGHV